MFSSEERRVVLLFPKARKIVILVLQGTGSFDVVITNFKSACKVGCVFKTNMFIFHH